MEHSVYFWIFKFNWNIIFFKFWQIDSSTKMPVKSPILMLFNQLLKRSIPKSYTRLIMMFKLTSRILLMYTILMTKLFT